MTARFLNVEMFSPDYHEIMADRYHHLAWRIFPLASGDWAIVGHGAKAELVAVVDELDVLVFLREQAEEVLARKASAASSQQRRSTVVSDEELDNLLASIKL